MTEPETPTPTEATKATPYNPGGDMTDGVTRAHIETADEIDADPIEDDGPVAEDPPVQQCEACGGSGADLDEACPLTESGTHTLSHELSSDETDTAQLTAEDEAGHKAIDRALYGDTKPYATQHAKVLRFELSIGKDDADRTIEEFETDIRDALGKINGTSIHNITAQGGHYLIDGKVCLPADYDPATKNRKPGTYPPPWAGGPIKGKEQAYLAEQSTTKSYIASRESVNSTDTAEETVSKLAGNMTREVKAKS